MAAMLLMVVIVSLVTIAGSRAEGSARGGQRETGTDKKVELVAQLGHSSSVWSATLSGDGKYLVTGSFDGTAKLWEVESGRELRSLKGHSEEVRSVVLSDDGKSLITGSKDATTRIWNLQDGKELCRLISFDDGNWAVTDSEGRFDASNGGDIEGLHWVVSNETIDLKQLKDHYYEPNLLAKIMGFNKEPLRPVQAFSFGNVKLFPTIQLKSLASNNSRAPAKPPVKNILGEYEIPADASSLELSLSERGGGIGRVEIYVNGKHVEADARGAKSDPNAKSASIQLNFQPYKKLMLPGKNTIEIVAYNGEESLASRSVRAIYTAQEGTLEPPHLWAIVTGVSDYQGDKTQLRNLRYAAKDAEAIAQALRVAGERLFPERVHITLLTSGNARPEENPSKQNIVAALKELGDEKKSQVKANDVFIFYLAGHGVSYGGVNGDFYFLTADAFTADLKDSTIREATALSSEELAKLAIPIPANKQVMILDTCASGRLIETLTESRSVDSSTIRAWDRMKDRTGFWMLAGCAADAVSYESSRYGQGVLTYSLLQVLKQDWQMALRKDEKTGAAELVDVSAWFNYSADEVPRLARRIGGIQRPLIANKNDARSFDVGRVTSADRENILLAMQKPVFLRSSFQLEGRPRDPVELTKLIDDRLREASTRGLDARLVFWDVPQHPGAYRMAGYYQVDGKRLKVKLYVSKFVQEKDKLIEQDVGEAIMMEGDTDALEKLVAEIIARAESLKEPVGK